MTFTPLSVVVSVPESKKYLNRDGLEEYNSLLPHSSDEMQEYVNDWLDEHPEATTTVQDGAITEPKLADNSVSLRTIADDTVHMLKGMMTTREISGDIITADDAYSAPPMALTVEGKSTQDGTPKPDAPVEIVSIEQVLLHASADGTTDAQDWPILFNLTRSLRSVPIGSHDALAFAYARPSTHANKAWYKVSMRKKIDRINFDAGNSLSTNRERHQVINKTLPSAQRIYDNVYAGTPNAHKLGLSNRFQTFVGSANYVTPGRFVYYNTNGNITIAFPANTFANLAEANAWLAENETYMYLTKQERFVEITDLGEFELPILPAPDVTVWAAPSTGLQMQYIRDSNLVIQRIEEAIADQ